jgi:hypothetical protein
MPRQVFRKGRMRDSGFAGLAGAMKDSRGKGADYTAENGKEGLMPFSKPSQEELQITMGLLA